jgi:NAD(P)-dependent dehydrogenase (short-subunit alcohol dehydrogenase family)
MVAAMPEKALTKATSQIPVARLGHPDEVARVVHFPRRRRLLLISGQVWGAKSELDM